MTEEQLDELKESFNLFDRGGDGVIEAGTIAKIMRSLGYSIKEEDVLRVFNDYGEEAGKLDLPEFIVLLSSHLFETTDESILSQWRILNPQDKKAICLADFNSVLQSVGEPAHEEWHQIFDQLEDSMTFADFSKIMKQK
uniref:EF-hand domain-containing protein n=1 Tax=Arcella intermedia TaxID=1963864 RepID=A0A6B2LQI6_9EUKA